MHTSLFSRCTSALIGLLFISVFFSAQAADSGTKSLGAWKAKDLSLLSGNYTINGMAFGNNTYVIVGANTDTGKNFVATSLDAETWTLRNTGSSSEAFTSVIFSKGRFIAVCKQPDGAAAGNARIWISDTNGATWVTKSSDNAGVIVPGGLHSVASDGNGKLVAVGGVRTTGSYGWITVSADNGSTWRVVRSTASLEWWVTGKLYGVGYAKGKWYIFTDQVSYKSSNAGTTIADWGNSYPSLDGVDTIGHGPKVASSKTTVVVTTKSGCPKWSRDDGLTWHNGIPAKGFGGITTLTSVESSVIYEDGTFVLSISGGDDIWTSENGQTWKRWKLPTASDTYSICYGNKSFWCVGTENKISKSPAWFKARLGCSSDYPFTLFDAEDGPPNRIGLPQYRVNTSSLNLVLEGTLFYTKTLGAPINLKLVYNSKPTANGDSSIGLFGKNWCFRYESVVGRFGQDAQLVNGGGRSFTFTTPAGEDLENVGTNLTLKAPDGVFDTLVYHGGGSPSFELTLKSSHLTYWYETKGTTAGVNDGLFYLTRIQDQFGNTTTLTVAAANGQINSVANGGRTFTFNYTNSGLSNRLCSDISIPGRPTVRFSYDSDRNLIGITDMAGYVAAYEYDKTLADKYGFLTKMTTAGKATTFTYIDRPGYEAASGAVENAGDKYLSEVRRPSGFGTIKYELMDEGDTVKRTSPSGQVTLISNKGGQTTSIKDPLGNVRNTTFNDAKLPSSVTDEKKGVYTYTYDDYGNILTQTDAMNNNTTYEYDTNHIDLLTVTDARRKTWRYTYNTKYQPTTVTTPLNNVTTMTYNPNGRLASIIDALPEKNTTSFNYDAYGNLWTKTPPTGGATILTYDGQGFRCVTMTDGNVPANTKTITWDNNDRITEIKYDTVSGTPSYKNEYNAFGQTKFTDELGYSSTVARDDLGFVTSVTDPLSNITQTEYDADLRPSKTIDPLGRETSTSYDSAGRPILFTDAIGFKIVKEYDGVGNLASFKDKNGAETKYVYDKNGRLTTTTDPLNKVTTITRNELGKTLTITNARLQVVSYEYDDDSRLKKKTSRLTATGAPTTVFENTLLDKNGNITKQIDLWGKTDATATKYEYDANNRVTKITYPDLKIVSLTYNNGGNIATITYPDGLVATYTYDKFNRQTVPSILKNNPGTELVGESRSTNAITNIAISGPVTGSYALTYNNRGNIEKITRSNGIQTDYTYDIAGRMTQVKHSVTVGGENLFTADYTPDALGNMSSESFTGTNYYSSAQTLPANTSLLYNVAGELTKKGAQACISDADGNLTDLGAGTVKCTYDPENRLTTVDRKTATTLITTNNTYNANGLRVIKTVTCGGGTTYYHYLPSGVLLFITDSTGSDIYNILAGNAILATYNNTSSNWLHYFCDRQGHVRFITDNTQPTGAVLVQYDYLPYGKVASNKLGINDSAITTNPFTYVGGFGVQDEGNGIFYMKNRFYDAGTGRFLHRDPISFEGGSNLYAYTDENPLRYIDPCGTASLGEWAWWGLGQGAKITVAVAAGAAAVAYIPVAVGTGIAIGATVYAGEAAIQALYDAGHNPLVKESLEFHKSKKEFDINNLDEADRQKQKQDELIKKTKDAVATQTGDISPTL